MHAITAVALYPSTTPEFPYVLIVDDAEDGVDCPDVPYTAYGVAFVPSLPTDTCTALCDRTRPCDVRVEHGAPGAPRLGLPAHLECMLEREVDWDVVGLFPTTRVAFASVEA